MLKNEVLDVRKVADTVENEPFQVPEIQLWAHYGCSVQEYLVEIEPGCTFIQDSYQERADARAAERAALVEAGDA